MIICPECLSMVVANVRGDDLAGDRRLRRSLGGAPYHAWVTHWCCLDCGNRFEQAHHIPWMSEERMINHGKPR